MVDKSQTKNFFIWRWHSSPPRNFCRAPLSTKKRARVLSTEDQRDWGPEGRGSKITEAPGILHCILYCILYCILWWTLYGTLHCICMPQAQHRRRPRGARKSDLNDAIFYDSLRKLDKIPLRWEGRFWTSGEEIRHSKWSFGWGELRTGGNSKTSGIRDFESTHPTENIFYGMARPGNRFFEMLRLGGFGTGREVLSPAGEISEEILEIPGGFLRFSWQFQGFLRILKNFKGF